MIDCKQSHKKFIADVKSAEIGNTQLTKYAVRLEQQQQEQQEQVNDRNTLVVLGQSIWRRQVMPRFCIRRREDNGQRRADKQTGRQTDRRQADK